MKNALILCNVVLAATILFLLSGKVLADSGIVTDGSIVATVVSKPDKYIPIPKPIPSGLPPSVSTADVKVTPTAPVPDAETQIVGDPQYTWSLVSVNYYSGTSLSDSNYNSGSEDPVIVSPNDQETNVKLGLNVTGHVVVTLQVTATWTIAPISNPSATRPYTVPNPQQVTLDFYGLQVKLTSMPRTIAANASEEYPIAVTVTGSDNVEIDSGNFYLQDSSGDPSANGAATGFLSGDQANGSGTSNGANGKGDVYTMIIPPSVFSSLSFTGSHRSTTYQGWIDVKLHVTDDSGNVIVGGDAVTSGKVALAAVMDNTVQLIDLGSPVASGSAISAFSGLSADSHQTAVPYLQTSTAGDHDSLWPTSQAWYLGNEDGWEFVSSPESLDTSIVASGGNSIFSSHDIQDDVTAASPTAAGYNQSATFDTANIQGTWISGDSWTIQSANEEDGVILAVYYGGKQVTDLAGASHNIVNVDITDRKLDFYLFQGCSVYLNVSRTGSTGAGPAWTWTASAATVAAGVCAIIGTDGAITPWVVASGVFGVTSGLTSAIASSTVGDLSQSSARAELFGCVAIQSSDGTTNVTYNPYSDSAYGSGSPNKGSILQEGSSPNTLTTASADSYENLTDTEVRFYQDADANTTWKVFTSGNSFATATRGELYNYKASASVQLDASGGGSKSSGYWFDISPSGNPTPGTSPVPGEIVGE